ncbi:DoxX family protein [Hydrogenimonas thermophila]|uniref:Putative oxidoreductase n=1 Tax=Hydrogenimonas thermophila TaxID=223786 RepID=A0A1I5LY02_9BACT|nr:DoxX family protein [Hydrogenimonas thermophila]SFP01636.1 putative oxidoreductase [Hydrogenimonas thermophila]
MLIKLIYIEFSRFTEYFKSLSLLFVRLILAYGFFEPAMMKWSDISAVSQWFGSMGIPFPTLNAYLAATTELSGVVLLTLGFMTRLIAIPLIAVMIVAIITVHLPQGFSAGNNGFEIPLYYMIMLFVLVTHGPGRFSIDEVVFEER